MWKTGKTYFFSPNLLQTNIYIRVSRAHLQPGSQFLYIAIRSKNRDPVFLRHKFTLDHFVQAHFISEKRNKRKEESKSQWIYGPHGHTGHRIHGTMDVWEYRSLWELFGSGEIFDNFHYWLSFSVTLQRLWINDFWNVFFFKNIFWRKLVLFLVVTGTSVLDFWWYLFWVSNLDWWNVPLWILGLHVLCNFGWLWDF